MSGSLSTMGRGAAAPIADAPRYLPGTASTRGAVLPAYSAPWSAVAMLREWCVDRAAEIVSSGAPDANDYGALIPRDGDDWDVAALAEILERAVMDDPSFPESWSIGPWWERRHAVIEEARFDLVNPFPAAPKVIAATAKHEARKDGTYRTSRKRTDIAIGGRGKFTAQGAPLSPSMAAFGALLPDVGASADDAYRAAHAMSAAGLIPKQLGGEDWAPQEQTPELRGRVLIESQRENVGGARRKPLPERSHALLHEATCAIAIDRREARKEKRPPLRSTGNDPLVYCSCDPTTRITERVTGPRSTDVRKTTAMRGETVLASQRSAPWARRHIGDAIVVVAPREDWTRAVEIRRPMDKGRKITRYIGGKAKPNTARNAYVAKVPSDAGGATVRTNRAEARREILALLATIDTEGASATFGAWSISCEIAATARSAARFTATDGNGATVTDTPRGLATALAAL